MITNLDTTAWLREHIAMETEGERSPAQCFDGAQTAIDWAQFGELSALLKPQAA